MELSNKPKTLTLYWETVNDVLQYLANRPYNEVAYLIDKLIKESNEGLKKVEEIKTTNNE